MIFKKFKDSKLMSKLIITYLLLTVIPITLLGYIAYSNYSKSIETQAGEYIPKLLEQTNENIHNKLDEFKELPDSLYNSAQVIEVLRKDSYQSNSTLLKDEFLVNSYLTRLYINGGNNDILGVFILSKGRMFSSTQLPYTGFTPENFALPYGKNLDLQGQEEFIFPYQSELAFEGNPPFLLMMRQLSDNENQENLGTVFVAIRLDFIEESLKSLQEEQSSAIWLTDERGQIIFGTEPAQTGTMDANFEHYPRINGSFQTTNLKENELISAATVPGSGWFLFHRVLLSDLTKETDLVRNGTIIVFIVFVVLSTIISIIMAWNVSHPLSKLTKLMKKAEKGNFNVDLPVKTNDEVGILANSFNSMVAEINQLIKKNYQIELQQKDAELYALQSQINPHFMYNTLETIGYAVEEEEKEEVAQMLTLLGRMLRYSLNNKEKLVPLVLEVNHMKDYLTIQKFRFEERIEFQIHEEIDSGSYMVPKFILQPVIENAIKYGLEQTDTCVIEVFISKTDENELMLRVKDNGTGMDELVLKELNRSLHSDPMARRDSKFGLINVHGRINMVFGHDYGVEVKSEPGNGTEVIIKIPAVTTVSEWEEKKGDILYG